MANEGDRIRGARAGGTSGRKSSGNPPAISFSIKKDIAYLEQRGFDCSSPEARYVIERVGMHRLEAYLPVVWGNSRAISFVNTTIIEHDNPALKEAHDLLTYDRHMQAVILKYIGIIESQFRARYSRAMSSLHGDMALYDPALFRREEHWARAMEDASREIARKASASRTMRRALDADGKAPVGVSVEYMTLGTLSKLYNNTSDQTVVDWVAHGMNSSARELRGWLRTVADVRNICAHFNPYIVRRQIPATPLPIRSCELSNRSPFYIFPLLETMLSSKDAKRFDDQDLDYSAGMIAEATEETVRFAKAHIATAVSLDVPKRFIDPSVTTWEGTGVDH